jgi:hypothetical protein
MPQKIFISYRREDAGANALGISQYLEKEFGRKNVFIDVDMRAGAKFPAVLEERLAECKVMLVLIGPEWLNSRSEDGQRRIDLPDDWVRLEIAQALKRDITVIPVRVNGAMLPLRERLPEDIRGLLDHQAVSLTLAGFRHEMSGLVRDIRAIPSPPSWRRFGIIAAGFVCLLAALAAVWALKPLNLLETFRLAFFTQPTKTVSPSGGKTVSPSGEIWSASPGEWVLYGADTQFSYYFKADSIKKVGDRAVITSRAPFKPSDTTTSGLSAAYQDTLIVLDCKKDLFATAETTSYNKAGEIISHFKEAEPEALNASAFAPVPPNSVVSLAVRIACDESVRTSLGEQVKNTKLTYYSGTSTGDGNIFYGPAKKLSESLYQYEVLIVTKYSQDHSVADIVGKAVLISAQSYRSTAQLPRFNCTDRKVLIPKTDSFDAQGNLVVLNAAGTLAPFDVKGGTPFGFVFGMLCGATGTNVSGTASATNVSGTYDGNITTNYKKGGQGEQKISITVEQTVWNDFKVAFKTANGAQGQGVGKSENGIPESVSLQSTNPQCAGSYDASFKFADDAVTFSFKGEDCGGPMEGNGTAKKVKT